MVSQQSLPRVHIPRRKPLVVVAKVVPYRMVFIVQSATPMRQEAVDPQFVCRGLRLIWLPQLAVAVEGIRVVVRAAAAMSVFQVQVVQQVARNLLAVPAALRLTLTPELRELHIKVETPSTKVAVAVAATSAVAVAAITAAVVAVRVTKRYSPVALQLLGLHAALPGHPLAWDTPSLMMPTGQRAVPLQQIQQS
ncbi:unannotated protein [freshwater metagenome]|uniref:Unannotated protein n=1 Tax=freshwater metagenome TaxID=449393 RepID=A0A6J7VC48_9ZZZZ